MYRRAHLRYLNMRIHSPTGTTVRALWPGMKVKTTTSRIFPFKPTQGTDVYKMENKKGHDELTDG